MLAGKDDTYREYKTLKVIQRTCDDCHVDYQSLKTAIYRSPHYVDIKLKVINGNEHRFEVNMGDLSESIKRILVALDDGHKTTALQANQNPASHDQVDETTLKTIIRKVKKRLAACEIS